MERIFSHTFGSNADRSTRTATAISGTQVALAGTQTVISETSVALTATEHLGPDGIRELSWQLHKLDVDLVVSPGVVDVAGPRLTMRARIAGRANARWS